MILNNIGIELPLENVLRLFNDYVLLTRSYDEASRILSLPYIQVENHFLAIVGWTLDRGRTQGPATLGTGPGSGVDVTMGARHSNMISCTQCTLVPEIGRDCPGSNLSLGPPLFST